jgi:hypothetical protein
MKPPRKHHHNPSCYLKQWAVGEDRQLCQFKRLPNGKIIARRKHPNATGFVIDLYKIDGLPDELAQAVETEFMKPVDDEADLALQKIVRDDLKGWTLRERSALSRFILSLRYRHPEGVRELKDHMHDVFIASLDGVRDHYSEQQNTDDLQTLGEVIADKRPELAHRPAMNLLREIIDDEKAGTTINNMYWARVLLNDSSVPLLTSDRPLDMPFGLADPNAYIALPVSPYVLFVAGHDDRWAKACEKKPPQDVVQMINQVVVAQARKTVWGIDDSQLAFVEQWMGLVPDRPLISPAQKKAAIAATQEESGEEFKRLR